MTESKEDISSDEYIICNCPHCNSQIQFFLNEINCHIFRHGIMKDTLKQIDPHLNKEECGILYATNLIYGCGKPFQLVKNEQNQYVTTICDYI